MFVSPGETLYEGMVIGIHSRDNDLVVNPIKGKQLTNVRASGKDEAVAPGAADRAHARVRGRVHRRRRARRGDAEVDPHPQALPEGARAQEGEPRGGVSAERAEYRPLVRWHAMIRAVLFDLDDTLVDHQHASRAAIAGVRERFAALQPRELDELVAENQRILDSMHHDVALGRATSPTRASSATAACSPSPVSPTARAAAAAELHRRVYQANRRCVEGALELVTLPARAPARRRGHATTRSPSSTRSLRPSASRRTSTRS